MTINKSVLSKLETEKYAKCICKKDIEVETVLIGFPGMGLAGAIAAQHISEELELETIGFVEGLAIPPVAVFLDGLLRHPYRIMGKEGLKTAVFIGESAVKSEVSYYISNAVMDWCDNHGAKNVIVL
ncbi:MAG: PAC2 family protein, partial [Asgard group archaeon]|nr:PAC2 family protein [Asgard group archaeon]